ncbi:MAG: DUF5040 domain-containing protein [Paludibacteraceae bacterium]
MKKLLFLSISILFFTLIYAQNEHKYTILLTGASFATPNNGWFELGCEKLSAVPINRAVGGESIAKTANKMYDETLYSKDEFENMDALVIMHVHDKNVCDESKLKADYNGYKFPFDYNHYAESYDYVIKRYLSECYELKNEPSSRYYGSKAGKPAVIILCTHWHDARGTYNASIRKLAEKWGLPIVEFDKYIGFSKNQLHPATNEQISLIYAVDSQTSNGEKFGWHPQQGRNSYIQQRMAAIFYELMQKILY